MSSSSGFLIDTCVISCLAPRQQPKSDPRVQRMVEWIERHGDSSYLSIVSLLEIEVGARKAFHKQETRKARELDHWLRRLNEQFEARLLPLDASIVSLGCDTGPLMN